MLLGGVPPPAPHSTTGNLQANEYQHHQQQEAAKLPYSQSANTMQSLMSHASMEPIRELDGNSRTMAVHSRSVSEPDFGRTPIQVNITRNHIFFILFCYCLMSGLGFILRVSRYLACRFRKPLLTCLFSDRISLSPQKTKLQMGCHRWNQPWMWQVRGLAALVLAYWRTPYGGSYHLGHLKRCTLRNVYVVMMVFLNLF